MLEDCSGGAGSGQVLYENGSFHLAHHHTENVISGLLLFFDRIHIVDYTCPIEGSRTTHPRPNEYDVTEAI